MEYRVVITPEAQAAIDRDIVYIRQQASPEIADRWYHGLIEAIASLSEMPTRCGVIPEQWLFDDEFRQLLYGRRQHKLASSSSSTTPWCTSCATSTVACRR